MFTQRISMDCTREQYEKYLKDDLLKMGYKERAIADEHWGIIVNNCGDDDGRITNLPKDRVYEYNRTYLGSFNAPLFLAHAAMTDEKYGRYGEYWVFKGKDCAPEFISGNLYKAIAPINKVWCFIDEMGDENSFSENEKYFRKATVSEIMQKFGEPKQKREIIVNVICGFDGNKFGLVSKDDIRGIDHLVNIPIKGEYYYCKLNDGQEWAFISSGDKKHKTDFFCTVNLNSGFFDSNCYITPDNDIDYIRLATNDEKEILNKKMAEKGKYFDKERGEIRPMNFQSATEATVQDLLRAAERNISNYIWSPCQETIDELEAILILKSKGYKILKPKTWEEV